MRWDLCVVLSLVLVTLLMALVSTSAVAQPSDGDERIEMRAENQDFDFYFEVEGIEGRNPALGLRPGSTINVSVRNTGTTIHNLHFDTGDRSRLLDPGEMDEFVLRVPEDAEAQSLLYYWCDPHRDLGMIGTTRVATDVDDIGTGSGETGESDGLQWSVLVLLVVVSLLVRRSSR